MKTTTTVALDKKLHVSLKNEAAKDGRQVKSIINEAVAEWLAKRKLPSKDSKSQPIAA